MSGGETGSSALTTALAFHYQVLVGLEKCYSMEEGQSIWFERDGDVSISGNTSNNSTQTEVKSYSDSLTDHHDNFWKTLKNWLAPDFNHERYCALILHTTQPFGSKTLFKDWNAKNTEERLDIVKKILGTRAETELKATIIKPIVQLQIEVINTDTSKLSAVLAKVVLHTEAADETGIQKNISKKLIGIPKNNQRSYLQGLLGFMYESSNPDKWCISYEEFRDKCIDLTGTYSRRSFTFPPFTGREATDDEVQSYVKMPFVKKIHDIEHFDVVPDAIGNWLELQNALIAEFDGYPQFKDKTNQYQSELVKRVKQKRDDARLDTTPSPNKSKRFYNAITTEYPAHMGGEQPPLAYKNGLIHAAMDQKADLDWDVES